MKWICVIFGLVLFCQCGQVSDVGYDKRGDVLMDLNLQLLDSARYFNIRSVSPGKPVVLFFFSPYCPYCRKETESILKNIEKFKAIQLVFLSIDSIGDLNMFSRNYQISKYPNVIIGKDTGAVYFRYFNLKNIPHTSIYSKDHKLSYVFRFQTSAEEILDQVKEL
ncbi:TlpA family protein disulfide reductase [Chitinophaga varians]|uniref:TlpA family protein disulfide reductase n=1 Tax=Chitinophaga varians TaxID=2202339 RepID=A0A847S149_9BACT|nr:TlpA disulfide reductase family protein [Chitinophaga varians]NLR66838.1 TlpA family protein disulfide reductase [Chitinophaga varians]